MYFIKISSNRLGFILYILLILSNEASAPALLNPAFGGSAPVNQASPR